MALAIVLAPEDVAGDRTPVSDAAAQAIVTARCAQCHVGSSAPAGVRLDTLAEMRANAAGIRAHGLDERDAARERDGHDRRRSARSSSPGRRRPGRFLAVLEITAAGMRFVARWEDELAPQTVAAFKAILPLDDRIIHCRWSGESNWIPWGDRELGIGPENATSYPHPGELALYPGGQSETELLFPYGYCSFASKAGHLWANHFATLVEGQEQLKELGRLTLWEGAQPISFREL